MTEILDAGRRYEGKQRKSGEKRVESTSGEVEEMRMIDRKINERKMRKKRKLKERYKRMARDK